MRPKEAGFALLELSIVLVVIALIVVMGIQLQRSAREHALATLQKARLAQAHQAVTQFVLTHYRLPCPDIDPNGTGVEAQNGGACVSSMGWLPYITLGLPAPTKQTNGARIRYGVFSGASVATSTLVDFAATLSAAALAPPSTAFPYVPTDAGCASARLNPAFALALGEQVTQAAASPCFFGGKGQAAVQTDIESVADLQVQVTRLQSEMRAL